MDFSVEELDEIFNLAHQIISHPKKFSHICDGKILATLFYEPSTRTRFSFEAAMMRLGGKILRFFRTKFKFSFKRRNFSRYNKNGINIFRYNSYETS